MGWIKSLFGAKPNAGLVAEAMEVGKDAASKAVTRLDTFIEARWNRLPGVLIETYSERISAAIQSTEISPMRQAMISLNGFQRAVVDARGKMRSEIVEFMNDEFEVARKLDLTEKMDELIDNRLDVFEKYVRETGAKLTVERGPELVASDKRWRANFPELAEIEDEVSQASSRS